VAQVRNVGADAVTISVGVDPASMNADSAGTAHLLSILSNKGCMKVSKLQAKDPAEDPTVEGDLGATRK
jgi:hypothetical protein